MAVSGCLSPFEFEVSSSQICNRSLATGHKSICGTGYKYAALGRILLLTVAHMNTLVQAWLAMGDIWMLLQREFRLGCSLHSKTSLQSHFRALSISLTLQSPSIDNQCCLPEVSIKAAWLKCQTCSSAASYHMSTCKHGNLWLGWHFLLIS